MPAEDKISSIVDFGAIDAEQKRLASIIDGIVKQLKSAPTIKIGIEGAAGVKDLSKENMRLAESIKAVEALMRQRFATEAKLATMQTDYARATATARVETQKQTKELKDQASAELAVIGSRERALAQIRLLTAQKDKLNLLNEAEKKQYDDLVIKIEKYDKFLKSTGTSAEKQRANIGNYSGAINVLKLSLEEVSKKIEANTKAGKANSDVQEKLKKEHAILTQLVTSQAAGFAKGTLEVKANEKALLDLERAGLAGTKTYNDLALATGKLKDSLADVRARTKVLGSDTFVFDGLIKGAQSLAGAYGVAQGAAALFGNENEELQKTFVKLQAIMTVIQGLQAISTGLQKESAAMLLLQTIREKALLAVQTLRNFVLRGTTTATVQNTTATAAQAGAMNATTVATRATTGAMVGLRFAIIATGIGALLILLTSAANAMGLFGSKTDSAKGSLDSLNESIGRSNKLLDQVVENSNFQGELLVNKIKERGGTEKEVHDQTVKNITDEQNKRYSAYLANKKQADDLAKQRDNIKSKISKIPGGDPAEVDKVYNDRIKLLNENADKNFDAAQNKLRERQRVESEFRVKTAEDGRKKEEDLSKKSSAERKKLAEEAAKHAEDYAKRQKAAEIEIIRSSFEQKKKIAQDNITDEKLSQEIRLQNLSDFAKASQALIDFEKNTVTGDTSKTSGEKALAEQKAGFDSIELQKQVSAETSRIIKEGYERDEKLLTEHIAVLKIAQEEKFNKATDKIDIKANNAAIAAEAEYELLIEKATGEKKIVLEKELQDKLSEISESAELERLKIRETELNQQAGLLTLYGEDTTNVEKLITENLRQQSKIRKGIRDDNAQDEEDDRNKNLDKYFEYGKEALSLIQTFQDAATSKEKNRIQEQIILNDERTKREIDAVNASALSEQDKAAKITVIQARALAEKEKLQRRQKELDYDKARFDKQIAVLTLIAQIAINIAKQQYHAAALAGVALIKLIATPIPKFEKGTLNAPKGPAWVSEKGPELIQTKEGKMFLSPAQPTLMQLAGGEKITPADMTRDILKANNLLHLIQRVQAQKSQPIYEKFDFGEKMYGELKELNKKPPFIININNSWEGTADFNYHMKH